MENGQLAAVADVGGHDDELIDRMRARATDATAPYLKAAKLRLDKEALQSEYASRFIAESGMPVISLPDYEQLEQGEWLDRMAEAIDVAADQKEMRKSG